MSRSAALSGKQPVRNRLLPAGQAAIAPRRGCPLLFAILLLCVAAAAQAQPPWAIWSDPLVLSRYRDDNAVVQWSSFSPDPCTYGADGMVEPAALDCRYDHLFRPLGRHRQLRVEGGELVLVDERGAGALVRAWMTTGDGFSADFPATLRLRVRLDGNPVPFVDMAVNDWFAGGVPPFLAPLAGNRHGAAGAGFSYVPIVFKDGMQISLAGSDAAIDHARIWYQFNIHRVADDSAMGNSGVPVDWPALHAFVSTPPGQYPWPGSLAWTAGEHDVGAGQSVDLLDHQGADSVLALRLRVASPTHWQSVRLSMQFDGGEILEHALGSWFGFAAHAEPPPQSLLAGRDESGFAYLYWPLPFHGRARIRLSQTAGGDTAHIEHALALAGTPPPADAMRFGIAVHDRCRPAGRQHPDLELLDLAGRGRWAGLSSRQHNTLFDHSNYLEGDERIHVDGSAHPAWHGTGNEDFYNAGFYFDHGGYGHAFSLPLSGAPWHRMLAGSPIASGMYRLLLGDAIPFRSRLRVRLERGAYGDQAMCAQTTAWYYHEPLRAMATVAGLDLAVPASVAAANYQPPASALCGPLQAAYADEPPTHLAGRVCRFSGDASTFRLRIERPAQRLWLRRRFDGQDGGQAAQVLVDDVEVARFPYAQRNPHRRWQEVEIPLAMPPQAAGSSLRLRIVPLDTGVFTEAAYTLRGDVGDALFADGFQ